jgi:aryl-alcohol dehydrogenase-like predicted oxidoreductase
MRYRPLGPSGISASVVGLGAWAIGGFKWGGTDERDSVAAIRAAIDHGVTLIDTAPVYGFGLSEELVGKGIAGRRDEVVLATKCGLVWHVERGQHWFDTPDRRVFRCLAGETIRYEVEQSLRRLGTDRIDLYQPHWQDSTTPIEETMGTLVALREEGKIRAIGVCNASLADLERYRSVGQLDSDQERYSMLDRGLEAERLPYCRERGMAVLAYSPMALGLLTGKIGPEREFAGDDLRLGNPRFSAENRAKVLVMLEELKPIAERHGLTYAQLVIAWTVEQHGLTHALCGARNPRQAQENAAAGEVVLSEEELAAVNEALARHAADIP